MTIDWNVAFVNTLNNGKFPEAGTVKSKLQWIGNRLHCITGGFHAYCNFDHEPTGGNADLDYIEDCLIQIIDAASTVLVIVRHLKKQRVGIKDNW